MAKFKPGQSGNAAGRPRCRADEVMKAIKKEFGGEPEFWDHIAKAAKAGDAASMGYLVARVKAPFRARSATVKLDIDGDSAKDFTAGVLRAVSGGELPPDEASALLNAILAGEKLEKLEELETKLDSLLEAQNGNH